MLREFRLIKKISSLRPGSHPARPQWPCPEFDSPPCPPPPCFFCWFEIPALNACPRPTATAPMAWAVPEASTAPPAPAAMAGIAGIDPAVMRMALIMLIALGCSLVINSSALHAFRSHAGACVVAVTVYFVQYSSTYPFVLQYCDSPSPASVCDRVGEWSFFLASTTAVSDFTFWLGGRSGSSFSSLLSIRRGQNPDVIVAAREGLRRGVARVVTAGEIISSSGSSTMGLVVNHFELDRVGGAGLLLVPSWEFSPDSAGVTMVSFFRLNHSPVPFPCILIVSF